MKKVMVAACVAVLFTSCKKDWTCECGGYSSDDYTSYTIKNQTKRSAKKQCEGKVSVGFVQVGGNNCGLKK